MESLPCDPVLYPLPHGALFCHRPFTVFPQLTGDSWRTTATLHRQYSVSVFRSKDQQQRLYWVPTVFQVLSDTDSEWIHLNGTTHSLVNKIHDAVGSILSFLTEKKGSKDVWSKLFKWQYFPKYCLLWSGPVFDSEPSSHMYWVMHFVRRKTRSKSFFLFCGDSHLQFHKTISNPKNSLER